MEGLYDKIQEAVRFIQGTTDLTPSVGIVLGTGLGALAEEIEVAARIAYADIPHFPVSTVESHKGELILGSLSGKKVVAMSGRFHYYEGYSMQELTFPIRVMKFLGIETIMISNAAGSTNAAIEAGDMVFIRDHINLQPENPLRGKNDERLGIRFPDMLETYDKTILAKAEKIAKEKGLTAHTGVYVGLQGPNLETPAEYRYLNTIGGDVVGMSTVPEVLVARHSGLRVFVVSVVSNKCFPIEEITETTLEEVIAVVQSAEPKVAAVVRGLLESF